MARLPYPEEDDLPDRTLIESAADPTDAASDLGRSLDADELNVYRAMAHNPAVLEGFRAYVGTLWSNAGLSARERQLLILAIAAASETPYEWHQHVRVGLDEGLTPEEIRAVSSGDLAPLDSTARTLVEYATRFVTGTVDDETHARLAEQFDDDAIVGITALAGVYLGLAHALDALDLETEVPFVGWNLENL